MWCLRAPSTKGCWEGKMKKRILEARHGASPKRIFRSPRLPDCCCHSPARLTEGGSIPPISINALTPLPAHTSNLIISKSCHLDLQNISRIQSHLSASSDTAAVSHSDSIISHLDSTRYPPAPTLVSSRPGLCGYPGRAFPNTAGSTWRCPVLLGAAELS